MADKYRRILDYAKLADDAYKNREIDYKFESYTVVKTILKTKSGFQAIAYEKDNEIVVAIRGTEPLKNFYGDLLTADLDLLSNKIPLEQSKDMVKYINELKSEGKFNNKKVTIAGHSLGGTLAQIAAKMFPNTFDNVYTFNSPSGKELKIQEIQKDSDERLYNLRLITQILHHCKLLMKTQNLHIIKVIAIKMQL